MDILQSFAAHDTIVQTLLTQFSPSAGDDPADTMSWRDFVDALCRFHSTLLAQSNNATRDEKEVAIGLLTVPDCCRLLYRFDVKSSGWISARLFQQCVVSSLGGELKKTKQLTAVRNARRPDVDAFSTPNAVQKLFLARAQQQRKPQSPTTQPMTSSDVQSTRKSLVHAGNTHLARIRSLPVSKLLRYAFIFPHTSVAHTRFVLLFI